MTPLVATSLALLLAATSLARPPRHRDSGDGTLYDQRQNGTDNLRLHVDGVVVIHAPVESLTALAAAADTEDLEQQLAELLGSLGGGSSAPTTGAAVQAPGAAPQDAKDPARDKDDPADKPDKDKDDAADKPDKDKDDAAENPKKDPEVPVSKPQKHKADTNEKPSKKDRPRIRLSSLLIPLLRRL